MPAYTLSFSNMNIPYLCTDISNQFWCFYIKIIKYKISLCTYISRSHWQIYSSFCIRMISFFENIFQICIRNCSTYRISIRIFMTYNPYFFMFHKSLLSKKAIPACRNCHFAITKVFQEYSKQLPRIRSS